MVDRGRFQYLMPFLGIRRFNTDTSLNAGYTLLGPDAFLNSRVHWNRGRCLICTHEVHFVLFWRLTPTLREAWTCLHVHSFTSFGSTGKLLIVCMGYLLLVKELGSKCSLFAKCLNLTVIMLATCFISILRNPWSFPLKWFTSYCFVIAGLLILHLQI